MEKTGAMTQTGASKTIRLGDQLGDAGGEGIVRAVEGRPELAAKIYYPEKRAGRRDKILAMVKAGFHSQSQLVAFPVDVLADDDDGFLGFTMRRFDDYRPVHELYGMQDRWVHFPQATFPFLVRSAENAARAVASVHEAGCVVGDISHSNILISPRATAALVDSDSFQVTAAGGRTFFSGVGTMEFLPPELHGERLDDLLRTENHDRFSLAVLIFQLLFLGRHPFHGRYRGAGDLDSTEAIRSFRFAYSERRRSETLMDPPPGAPSLGDIYEPAADAFERAFSPDTVDDGRPGAREWVGVLERMEKDLIRCSANGTHHHARRAPSCPWCRVEAGSKAAVFPLPPATIARSASPSALKPLRDAVDGTPEPGSVPDLERLVRPAKKIRPSFHARERQIARWARGLIWLLLLFAGVAAALLHDSLPAPWRAGWVFLIPAALLTPHAWNIRTRAASSLWLAAWAWSGLGALLASFSSAAGVAAATSVALFSFIDAGGWWRLPLVASLGAAGYLCARYGVMVDPAFFPIHALAATAVTIFGLACHEWRRHRKAPDFAHALADAEAAWRLILRRWRRQAETTEFVALKAELHSAADRLAELAEAEPGLHALPDKAERRRRLLENAQERSLLEARLRRGPAELKKVAMQIAARRREIPASFRKACLELLQARENHRVGR